MKKVVFILSVVVVFTSALGAQTFIDLNQGVKHEVTEPNQDSKAEMKFETDFHNFDTIEYGGNGTFEFKFKNTGTEPVIISNAQGSCGCTVPTYPKDVPIKPGESQAIKVTYDTKRPGTFTKTVTVNSNSKDPIKVLTIKGYVRPKPVEVAFPTNGSKTDGFIPFDKH